jgi:4-fold beta-flower domain-containing protein
VFALTEFDAVFAFSGTQIGWWYGNHIRDRYGRVVLARPGAKIEGLTMPRPKRIPDAPKIHLPTGRPLLRWLLPPPPIKQRGWTDFEALFDNGLARLRAFEKKAADLCQQPRSAAPKETSCKGPVEP